MREQWFLKVDGIPGESVDARHRGEIEVQSWSWGVTNSGGGGFGGGGGGGKAAVEDFQCTAYIGVASPKLFRACATGTHIRTVTLSGVRSAGGGAFDFLTYALSDVLIAGVHHGDATGGAPTEQVSLRFAKVEMTYRPQQPDGSIGTPVTAVFDVKQNR